MFKLDIAIFNFLYNQCKILGHAFGFTALEGGIIYLGIITMGIFMYLPKTKKAKK